MSIAEGLDEVAWVEVAGNNAYVGFIVRPPDIADLLGAWAMQAYRKTDNSVHVWAVPVRAQSKVQDRGQFDYHAVVSVRGGKIVQRKGAWIKR